MRHRQPLHSSVCPALLLGCRPIAGVLLASSSSFFFLLSRSGSCQGLELSRFCPLFCPWCMLAAVGLCVADWLMFLRGWLDPPHTRHQCFLCDCGSGWFYRCDVIPSLWCARCKATIGWNVSRYFWVFYWTDLSLLAWSEASPHSWLHAVAAKAFSRATFTAWLGHFRNVNGFIKQNVMMQMHKMCGSC